MSKILLIWLDGNNYIKAQKFNENWTADGSAVTYSVASAYPKSTAEILYKN
jgi:hypothetical protein